MEVHWQKPAVTSYIYNNNNLYYYLYLYLYPLYIRYSLYVPRQTMSLGDTLLQLLFRFIVNTLYGAYLPRSYLLLLLLLTATGLSSGGSGYFTHIYEI